MTDAARDSRLPPDVLSDEEVVARVLEGDHALFELIMRRHNQRLYRTIRAILRDEAEVEDAMQQAYVNAYRHLGQFAGQARFSTWLTRIAVHEAFARSRRGRLVLAESGCGEPCADVLSMAQSRERSPEENASNRELQTLLEEAILGLPEAYRLVFVMRELEGLSTEETASALEVSLDVVKTRLHRARARLRDALYARAGLSSDSLFAFRDPRCNRVVAAVLEQIAVGPRSR
jgi:RNA polymerase sigma-70 factor (ECF subfamily)